MDSSTPHKHTTITRRAIRQRNGIPYEVEQRICVECRQIVGERPLRRTAA